MDQAATDIRAAAITTEIQRKEGEAFTFALSIP